MRRGDQCERDKFDDNSKIRFNSWGHRGLDRMVVEFITITAISAYHLYRPEPSVISNENNITYP